MMLDQVKECAHCAVEISVSEAKYDDWYGAYCCSLRCVQDMRDDIRDAAEMMEVDVW